MDKDGPSGPWTTGWEEVRGEEVHSGGSQAAYEGYGDGIERYVKENGELKGRMDGVESLMGQQRTVGKDIVSRVDWIWPD